MVEHPAGYAPLLAHSRRGRCGLRDNPALSASGKTIGFGAAVPRPARSHAYASPTPSRGSAPGLLPARAGSPLAGQDSHLLDDKQSFMKVSHPPIPFDPQGLVALDFLSTPSCIASRVHHVSHPVCIMYRIPCLISAFPLGQIAFLTGCDG